MGLKNRGVIWGVLAVVAIVVLSWLAPSSASAPRVKARAQRITSVNTVRSISFTLTNSSTLPGARPASRQ